MADRNEASLRSFIDNYVEALRNQNASVFAGAGLSIPAGLVDWKGLLRNVAREINLDVDKETDLVTVAQFHVNEKSGGRHRINQALIDEFAGKATLTDNHRILASLPIRTFWTTNYDKLIEDSLRAAGKNPDVKITVQNLATTLPRRDAVVYKMHGDVSLPDEAVVTKDDYETYNASRHLFSLALQGDLVSKTFLFLGFSFSDPNLNYILGRIRVLLGEAQREHYCLMRRVQRKDFRKPAEFQYATAKQDLQVKDLRRYGISGVLVDDYSEYTEVLKRISDRFKRGSVFISGSAATYDPFTESVAQQLLHETARRLIREGFTVVSGFGLGVGSYVLNGVLDELQREATQALDDRLILRPFPFNIADATERQRVWKKYREDMMSHAGIAVFMFGNKQDATGNTIYSDGVEAEFNIAVEKGLVVVPVGCTGSVSEKLHRKVMDSFPDYYPQRGYKAKVNLLGKRGTPIQVATRIVDLLKALRDGD